MSDKVENNTITKHLFGGKLQDITTTKRNGIVTGYHYGNPYNPPGVEMSTILPDGSKITEEYRYKKIPRHP